MKHPYISNDPITMIAEAFEALFPDIKYEAAYASGIKNANGEDAYSCTAFPNADADPAAVPVIFLNEDKTVHELAQTFAMELVHVLLGGYYKESEDEEYEKILAQIYAKYNEIGEARFPTKEGGDENEAQ